MTTSKRAASAQKNTAGPNRAARRAAMRGESQAPANESPVDLNKDTFSLDDLEAEASALLGEESERVFKFTTSSGAEITLASPSKLGYQTLASGDIELALIESMSDEDYEAFVEEDFNGRQIAALVMLWRRFYAIPDAGE